MDILKYGGKPEKYRIRSEDIISFLNDLNYRGMMMHSVMIIADGEVITEGYYPPFHDKKLQRMYSTSKTFVSAAIGCLIDEGKITLNDKIAKFFPEQKNVHPFVADTTIRDLLMMASPFCGGTYSKDGVIDKENWVNTFFEAKPLRPAGMTFNYDTSGTYMLDVIVERLAGKNFLEYLKDRMLREAGFSENATCIKAPEGYAWGGSGVLCTTRDLGRFAQIFANKGKIGEHQVLSEKYINEATSKQIDNAENGWDDVFNGNGYGYQIWMTKDGYAFLGMGGQLAVFYPDKKLILVTTADNQGHPRGYASIAEAFRYKVLDKMSDKPLVENAQAYKALCEKTTSLSVPIFSGDDHLPAEKKYFDRKFVLEENPMGIEWVMLLSDGTFKYKNKRGAKEYKFGFGEYRATSFPETHYYYETIGVPSGREYEAVACGRWTEANKFVIRTFITDTYLGNYTATFSFKEDIIAIRMMKTAEFFLDDYQGFAWGKAEK